jgi:hypothetical protein
MEGVEDVDHGGAEYRSESRSDTGRSPCRARRVIDEIARRRAGMFDKWWFGLPLEATW